MVCQYVEITGDMGILDATATFLEGPQLKDDEREAYFQPAVSIEHATLFEHCRRAIEKGTTHGPWIASDRHGRLERRDEQRRR